MDCVGRVQRSLIFKQPNLTLSEAALIDRVIGIKMEDKVFCRVNMFSSCRRAVWSDVTFSHEFPMWYSCICCATSCSTSILTRDVRLVDRQSTFRSSSHVWLVWQPHDCSFALTSSAFEPPNYACDNRCAAGAQLQWTVVNCCWFIYFIILPTVA